jgi:hypothetical protein
LIKKQSTKYIKAIQNIWVKPYLFGAHL